MRNKLIPISIFIMVQLAAITTLTLWIVWYSTEPKHVWWLLQGILLMIPVIFGATVIFVYWNKSRMLDAERVNFISSISHELLTPLASLKLYLETMKMRELDNAKQQQFIDLMLGDAERLNTLIGGVLTAARIERGKAQYNFEVHDIKELIESYLQNSKSILKDVTFNLKLQENCYCLVDEIAFVGVMKNLVENAIRYSESPAEIEINLALKKDKIQLSVEDKGEGLASKDIKKIFKVFYRASKKQGGSGLGLYIVQKTVKAHKGKVWATSEGHGKGLKINILVPAYTEEQG